MKLGDMTDFYPEWTNAKKKQFIWGSEFMPQEMEPISSKVNPSPVTFIHSFHCWKKMHLQCWKLFKLFFLDQTKKKLRECNLYGDFSAFFPLFFVSSQNFPIKKLHETHNICDYCLMCNRKKGDKKIRRKPKNEKLCVHSMDFIL